MSKMYRITAGLLLLLLLLSGCGGKTPAKSGEPDAGTVDGTVDDAAEPEQEEGAAAVSFEGTDMQGNAVTSDVFSQAKLTMVNVWATYCNPCLSEMPGLGELAGEYDAGDFQLIGIVSDVLEGEDQTLAESLIEQTGASYPHLLLNESLYYGLLADVSAVPTTFFLDGEGQVLDTVVGAMEKEDWKEKIDALLEER